MAVYRENFGYFRHTPRQRAGLVKDHERKVSGLFQTLAALDEQPIFGSLARAHHDGGRRGQPHRARAGDDQHRHGADQSHRGCMIENQHMGEKRGQGNTDYNRHKDGSHAVRQALNRGFRPLRCFHNADDLGQRRILTDTRRPVAERSVAVDRPAGDLILRTLLHRKTLAGQHGLIHRAAPLDDQAIHRELVAGADHHNVVGSDLLKGNFHLLPVPLDARPGRLQFEQSPDGVPRAALGAIFKNSAE